MKKHVLLLIAYTYLLLPMAGQAGALLKEDIDRYLKSYPVVDGVLTQINAKIKKNDKQDTKMAIAQMEGRMHRQMLEIIDGWPERLKLSKILHSQGFKSMDNWALVADRVSGVVMASTWVMAATAMGNNNKPLREDLNLFAYLDNKNNDPVLRKKYRGQLDEMCDRLCYDRADIKPVREKYTAITAVLK